MNFVHRIFNKKKENIIFLHLPKAGGTTLRSIFYDQYAYLKKGELHTINRTKETPDFLKLPQEKRDQIKILLGHFPFGLHNNLNGEFDYVTFMRDPIDRAISAYYYNKGNENSDVYDLINKNNLSLDQYLDKNIEPWSNNAMTKHLAGCNLEEFQTECTSAFFETAKANLKDKFIAVGLTERFDESLLIFKKKLGWRNVKYKNQNVTPKRKAVSEIQEETLRKIKNLNAFDLQLYEIGKSMFEKDLQSLN